MVKQFDLEDFRRLAEFPRAMQVGRARSRVAARVIVGNDQTRAAGEDMTIAISDDALDNARRSTSMQDATTNSVDWKRARPVLEDAMVGTQRTRSSSRGVAL